MNYMKLVTGGVKHHLCVADQPNGESNPLCGCVVTRLHSWKRVRGLDGDELPGVRGAGVWRRREGSHGACRARLAW